MTKTLGSKGHHIKMLFQFSEKIKNTLTMSPISAHNKSLWAISWVSFFGGMASLMVFSLLSVFMREELHLTYKELGAIEGIAVFMAFMAKVFSGILSDLCHGALSITINA